MTFRQKTILGVASIEAVLLLLLIWAGTGRLLASNEAELIKRASTELILLSRASRNAIRSADLATLQDIVDAAITTPELGYARILDPDGGILAQAGGHLPATASLSTDLNYASVDDGRFDSAIDIREGDTLYGRVEIGLSTSHINGIVSEARRQAGKIALMQMLLVALFSLALGTYLTRQLSALKRASIRIMEGELGCQLPVRGNDELAHTAKAFNRMSQQLQSEFERQHAIIKSALDCIITVDHEGRITEFNPMAEQAFGYSREEAIGLTLTDTIIPPPRHEAHIKGMKHFLATGEGAILGKRVEVTAMRADGSEFPIEMAVNVTYLGEGPVFTAYLRDISERREYETALLEAKKLAEEAAEAKSSFLANMSHEIRTPMNAILGLLGLLAEEENLTSQQQAWVKTAHQSSDALLKLINDTLDFSKIEASKLTLEKEVVDLRSLISTTIDMLSPRAQAKGVQLISTVENGLPASVEGDGGRLRQILVNLIDNAIKFTDEGEINLEVQIAGNTQSRLLRFAVHDTGIGIQARDQHKLFTKFTQLTRPGAIPPDGTGLGLAISGHLVDLMNGQISVHSEPGKGSCFWFEIPLVPISSGPADSAETRSMVDQAAPAVQQFLQSAPVTQSHPAARILLAEDNLANQVVTTALLKGTGYHIDTVINGREAVAAIQDKPYDLVLMDISMGEMNGMDATAAIRQLSGERGTIPIVAMTAHAIKGDREKFLAAGMDDYLSKPINKQLLLQTLDKWIVRCPEQEDPTTATAQPVQPSPALDLATLEQLAHDTSPAALPILIAAFRKDSASRVQAISQHLAPLAMEPLQREAHSLKSSAGTFGAYTLQQLAQELELACRNGQALIAEEAARKIPAAWSEVTIELDRYGSDTDSQDRKTLN